MKARLAVILGILLAIVFSVVVLIGPAPHEVVRVPEKNAAPSEPPERVDEWQPPPPTESASVPPVPASGKQDLAAIEKQFESLVDALPPWERFKRWVDYPKFSRMSDSDCEKARELFLRFMVNLAEIQTARFHVDCYEGETLLRREEVVWSSCKWSAPKYRVDQTFDTDGQMRKALMICDGKMAGFVGPHGITQRLRLGKGDPSNYLHAWYVPLVRDRRPCFLNQYARCEIGDGKREYSSVADNEGNEVRFDTATGLLTEYVFERGGGIKETYQQVDGLWFPREQIWDVPADPKENQRAFRRRYVFSRVALNEPVDEWLFDLNNPR